MNPSTQLIFTLLLATGTLAGALWLNARAKERRLQKQAREARRQVRRLTYRERGQSSSVGQAQTRVESTPRGGEQK